MEDIKIGDWVIEKKWYVKMESGVHNHRIYEITETDSDRLMNYVTGKLIYTPNKEEDELGALYLLRAPSLIKLDKKKVLKKICLVRL